MTFVARLDWRNWTLSVIRGASYPATLDGVGAPCRVYVAASVSHLQEIVTAWEEKGMQALNDGAVDLSLAIVDARARSVTLVRDHIGAQPLFWVRTSDGVVFGSSMQEVLELARHPIVISEAAVALYLSLPDLPLDRPLISGVHSAPPGHVVTLAGECESHKRWWTPRITERRARRGERVDEAAQHCRELLRMAVKRRLPAGGAAIGAHVSGGIDSTGVAALVHSELNARGERLRALYAWSPAAGFDVETQPDERTFLRSFSQDLSAELRFGGLGPAGLADFLERPLELEGVADLADELPILSAAREDGVKLMFSGWGGDEVFSAHGFGHLAYLLTRGRWRKAAKWIQNRTRSLRRLGPVATTLWLEGIHPLLPAPLQDRFHRYGFGKLSRPCISPDLAGRHRDLIEERRHRVRFTGDTNQNSLKHLQLGHIEMRMETWSSWAAAHGFSYAYPLTDRRLLEYVLALPPELRFPNEHPRGLARETLAGLIPADAGKLDPVNEACREVARTGSWRILAERERAGHFNCDCPWLDMTAFRALLREPLPQDTPEGIVRFSNMLTGVRVWHLWRRQELRAAR